MDWPLKGSEQGTCSDPQAGGQQQVYQLRVQTRARLPGVLSAPATSQLGNLVQVTYSQFPQVQNKNNNNTSLTGSCEDGIS